MKPDSANSPNLHIRLVERSRALHQAVAEKIRANPQLVQIARENLRRWLAEERLHGQPSKGLLEWEQILQDRSFDQILKLICDPGEEADRLRHATPFSGILTEAERENIYRHYATIPA
jgi:hypothetical protein